jgi:hypothetical protein
MQAAEKLIPYASKALGEALSRSTLLKREPSRAAETDEAISRHLRELANWSAQIQLLWLPKPVSTQDYTISLGMTPFARTVSGARETEKRVSDLSLLDGSQGHYLVVGVPGSGKTTTLKRLIIHMLFGDPSDEDQLRFPILIRLRDLPHRAPTQDQQLHQSWSLFKQIARVLAFKYEDHYERDQFGRPLRISVVCEGKPIEEIIIKLLDECRVLLLLDGLDELHPREVEFVTSEIQHLALNLNEARLILTSRTGTKERAIEGLSVFRIDPLDREQIAEIAKHWIDNIFAFLELLDSEPYAEIADRPLVLLQLLYVFSRYGYLPARPALAYRNSVKLLLKEWDASRGIQRVSRYSSFDPEQKFDFLCELAYDLTVRIGRITFSQQDLTSAYRRIFAAYGLPRNEEENVVSEIETHSGIIVGAGFNQYEFCHLSLQEYLAAEYIIRAPIGPRLRAYLRNYPAVVGVAVGLSSNPSEWLPRIILDPVLLDAFTEKSLEDFLKRMRLEKPSFSSSKALGIGVMSLVGKFYWPPKQDLCRELDKLIELDVVEKSISDSLSHFVLLPDASDNSPMVDLSYWRPRAGGDYLESYGRDIGLNFPDRLSFPRAALQRIIVKHQAVLRRSNARGRIGSRVVSSLDEGSDDDIYLAHNID